MSSPTARPATTRLPSTRPMLVSLAPFLSGLLVLSCRVVGARKAIPDRDPQPLLAEREEDVTACATFSLSNPAADPFLIFPENRGRVREGRVRRPEEGEHHRGRAPAPHGRLRRRGEQGRRHDRGRRQRERCVSSFLFATLSRGSKLTLVPIRRRHFARRLNGRTSWLRSTSSSSCKSVVGPVSHPPGTGRSPLHFTPYPAVHTTLYSCNHYQHFLSNRNWDSFELRDPMQGTLSEKRYSAYRSRKATRDVKRKPEGQETTGAEGRQNQSERR